MYVLMKIDNRDELPEVKIFNDFERAKKEMKDQFEEIEKELKSVGENIFIKELNDYNAMMSTSVFIEDAIEIKWEVQRKETL